MHKRGEGVGSTKFFWELNGQSQVKKVVVL
jgi:hypothetical protein